MCSEHRSGQRRLRNRTLFRSVSSNISGANVECLPSARQHRAFACYQCTLLHSMSTQILGHAAITALPRSAAANAHPVCACHGSPGVQSIAAGGDGSAAAIAAV